MKRKRNWIKDPDCVDEWSKAFLRSDDWILVKHDDGTRPAMRDKVEKIKGTPCVVWVLRNKAHNRFGEWAQHGRKLFACDHLPHSIKTQRDAIAYANNVIDEWEQAECVIDDSEEDVRYELQGW